eukprot:6184906-Pleurochrysis_carterae.AAC.3
MLRKVASEHPGRFMWQTNVQAMKQSQQTSLLHASGDEVSRRAERSNTCFLFFSDNSTPHQRPNVGESSRKSAITS